MAKPVGRPRTYHYGPGELQPMNIRVSQNFHAYIQLKAKQSGRSWAYEIQTRLDIAFLLEAVKAEGLAAFNRFLDYDTSRDYAAELAAPARPGQAAEPAQPEAEDDADESRGGVDHISAS